MSENPIARKRVVLELPGMDEVSVRVDVPYARPGADELGMDVYSPPGDAARPAVVFVFGYSDAGAAQMLGCKLKEMAAYECWARLVACSGAVGITYATLDPANDVHAVLAAVREHGPALGVDTSRLGLWSCSGNTPNALAAVASNPDLKCAVHCYGYLMDLAGSTNVADASATFGFVNPLAGRPLEDVPFVPTLLVRAGNDETPGLNACMDRFFAESLERDRSIGLINHAGAPHAFDLLDDTDASRAVITDVLSFLEARLSA